MKTKNQPNLMKSFLLSRESGILGCNYSKTQTSLFQCLMCAQQIVYTLIRRLLQKQPHLSLHRLLMHICPIIFDCMVLKLFSKFKDHDRSYGEIFYFSSLFFYNIWIRFRCNMMLYFIPLLMIPIRRFISIFSSMFLLLHLP